jgi:hypothetical protein
VRPPPLPPGLILSHPSAAIATAAAACRLYAFDVHCNSFLPVFLLLYGARARGQTQALPPPLITACRLAAATRASLASRSLPTSPACLSREPPRRAVVQLLASPLLLWQSRLAAALSAGLYAAALGHYAYLTFLGYAALPFLERTEVFLWPIAALAVAAPLAALSGFNATRFTLGIYFG